MTIAPDFTWRRRQKQVTRLYPCGMGRTTFVDVEEHPSLAVACLATLEGGVNGKAGGNPAGTLMEEACMACLQLRDKLMHFLLKFLRAFDPQNPVSPGFDYRVAVHAIKFRIEVFGFDKAAHLLENDFPVAAAETRVHVEDGTLR